MPTAAWPAESELELEGADPGITTLIERYVAAVRSSDLTRYEALHQPLLDQCRTAENRDAYVDVLQAEVSAHVEPEPGIVVQKLSPAEIRQKVDLLSRVTGQAIGFSAVPSHWFELTERSPYPASHPCASRPARVRKFVVRHEGEWKIVPQCLSEPMITSLRETRATKDAVRRMQAELYTELDPGTRAELLQQLQRGRTQTAFERATEVTGSNGKALRLVERLCEEL